METSGRRKDGSSVDVSMRLTPHIEPPGKTVGFSVILRDITSKKIAERALLQADKLASVERLASSISHELNNPLASVTNLLYLLQTGAKDDETRALVETAQSELARVSHVATHTLRFHRQATRKTVVGIEPLFQELIALYKGRFAGSKIVASADVEGSANLVCYEGELKQVMVNLISNAFDAMRQGGRLWLRCHDAKVWPSRIVLLGSRLQTMVLGSARKPVVVYTSRSSPQRESMVLVLGFGSAKTLLKETAAGFAYGPIQWQPRTARL